MKFAVSSRLSTTQQRSKRDFDRNVRGELALKIGTYELVDRPQLAAIASDAANIMANRRYTNMLHGASGPYRVLNVQPHTVAIEEDGIQNTLSIDLLTLSPTLDQVTEIPHETTNTTRRPKGNQ